MRLTAHQYFLEICKDSWVYWNMIEYHNSILPNSLIDTLGIRNTERILSFALDKTVVIEKEGSGYTAWKKENSNQVQ